MTQLHIILIASVCGLLAGMMTGGQITRKVRKLSQRLKALVERDLSGDMISAKAQDAARISPPTLSTPPPASPPREDSEKSSHASAPAVTAYKFVELGQSSRQIRAIMEAIEEIVDISNVLSLNAAVEAARAGEQGRQFALAASKVCEVAEQTGLATSEIAQLAAKVRRTGKGSTDGQPATSSLQKILVSAEQLGKLTSEIAAATVQQTDAAEQINGNIEHMAKITRDAIACAQQSAKACQGLANLALELQQLVSQMNLDRTEDDAPSLQVRPQLSAVAGSRVSKANGHKLLFQYDTKKPPTVQ